MAMNIEKMVDHLETERLVLFPYTRDNLALFNSDLPGFEKEFGVVYRGEELDYLLSGFLKKLEREIADDPEHYLFFTEFLIVLKAGSHIIGSIDYKYVPRDGITEVGYGLNPAYEGHGYMTEALTAFLEFGRKAGIRVVRADTRKDNVRSQNVLKRCGFRFLREDGNLWWERTFDESGPSVRGPAAAVYVHGKGGNAAEADRYAALFPGCDMIGFDYRSQTPQDAKTEFPPYFAELCGKYGQVILIANSIGAYFAMSAGIDRAVSRAYFISPVVDMERLIRDMMCLAGVTEAELEARREIALDSGGTLSAEYLSYVRSHPAEWNAPTEILYGSADVLIPYASVSEFALKHGAGLTVMDGGEHWFHTDAQLKFLDGWLSRCEHVEKENIMNDTGITYRLEQSSDHRAVEELIRDSFWNVYRPGCSEHYVIHVLREDPAFVPELDFVMELNGRLIGQNMFMKTVIDADDGRTVNVLTMGPICIAPELKRKGYGKKLLDFSMARAAELGFGAVLFEGNIGFYGKSGFDCARKFGIRYHDLPEGADDSFFLCRELIPGYLNGVTGVYQTPAGYYVDDSDVEAFDKDFPPKLKLKLPGQIF